LWRQWSQWGGWRSRQNHCLVIYPTMATGAEAYSLPQLQSKWLCQPWQARETIIGECPCLCA
jgi:hypothetical protein